MTRRVQHLAGFGLDLILVLLFGCTASAPCPIPDLNDSSADVFPSDGQNADPTPHERRPGDRWVFEVARVYTDASGRYLLTGEISQAVLSEPITSPTGDEVLVVHSQTTFFECESGTEQSFTSESYYSQDDSGVSYFHGQSRGNGLNLEPNFITEPVIGKVRSRPPFAIGATLKSSAVFESGATQTVSQRVVAIEEVAVPFGRFTAYRVEGSALKTGDGFESRGTWTDWVVPALLIAVRSRDVWAFTDTETGAVASTDELQELSRTSIAPP